MLRSNFGINDRTIKNDSLTSIYEKYLFYTNKSIMPTKLETYLNKLNKKELTSLAYICKSDIRGCKTQKDIKRVLQSKSKSCDILKTLQTGVMTPLQVRRLLRLKKSVLEELAKEIGIKVTDKDTKWTIVHKMSSTHKGAMIGAIFGASFGLFTGSLALKQHELGLYDPPSVVAASVFVSTLSAGVGSLIGAVFDRYSRRRMNINKLLRKARQKSRRSKH